MNVGITILIIWIDGSYWWLYYSCLALGISRFFFKGKNHELNDQRNHGFWIYKTFRIICLRDMTFFSVSYIGCHPSHWLICFKMFIAPPTRLYINHILIHILYQPAIDWGPFSSIFPRDYWIYQGPEKPQILWFLEWQGSNREDPMIKRINYPITISSSINICIIYTYVLY